MEKSEKFGFNLPSSNSDDIADINQISDNFRIIEEKIPYMTGKNYVEIIESGKPFTITKRMESGLYLLKGGVEVWYAKSVVEQASSMFDVKSAEKVITLYTDTEVLVSDWHEPSATMQATVDNKRSVYLSAYTDSENKDDTIYRDAVYTYEWSGTVDIVGKYSYTATFNKQENVESETEIPTFTLNVNDFESGYLVDGKITAHTSFITSPFLPVTELSTILLENIHSPALTVATFYDEQKNYLSIIKVNLNQYFASRTIQVPLGAKFMRCCTQPTTFTKTPMKVSYIHYAPENKTQKLLAVVNGLCEQTNYELINLFKKSAQPMITFIDDDTVSLEHIARYKNYCDAVGIKGCFSVLTSQLDEVDGLAEKLLEYEQDGFQAIIHCNTQGDEFKGVNASGQRTADNIALCEKNLVTGLQKMHKYGFTNYKYWCTPFGYSDPALQNMAKKWGINCLISSGNMDYNKPNASYKRWHISRFTLLGPSDDTGNTTLTRIKNAINQACLDGGWVLVTTHMYENGWADRTSGVARLKEILDYAKARGVTPTPIGEAFSIREPIYKFYETF